jgi:hypothetical protein
MSEIPQNPLEPYNITWVDVDGSRHVWPCESHKGMTIMAAAMQPIIQSESRQSIQFPPTTPSEQPAAKRTSTFCIHLKPRNECSDPACAPQPEPTGDLSNAIGLAKSIQGMCVDEESHEAIRAKVIELTEMLCAIREAAKTAASCGCDVSKGILCDEHDPIQRSAETALAHPAPDADLRCECWYNGETGQKELCDFHMELQQEIAGILREYSYVPSAIPDLAALLSDRIRQAKLKEAEKAADAIVTLLSDRIRALRVQS